MFLPAYKHLFDLFCYFAWLPLDSVFSALLHSIHNVPGVQKANRGKVPKTIFDSSFLISLKSAQRENIYDFTINYFDLRTFSSLL